MWLKVRRWEGCVNLTLLFPSQGAEAEGNRAFLKGLTSKISLCGSKPESVWIDIVLIKLAEILSIAHVWKQ